MLPDPRCARVTRDAVGPTLHCRGSSAAPHDLGRRTARGGEHTLPCSPTARPRQSNAPTTPSPAVGARAPADCAVQRGQVRPRGHGRASGCRTPPPGPRSPASGAALTARPWASGSPGRLRDRVRPRPAAWRDHIVTPGPPPERRRPAPPPRRAAPRAAGTASAPPPPRARARAPGAAPGRPPAAARPRAAAPGAAGSRRRALR
jgi:hypothetical protein